MTEWSRMPGNDLQTRVAAIRWYHTIDLGVGVTTNGVDDSPQRLARVQLPASLEGLSVLDIGAWDGFFSFECERRGASRVVAADYYSWHGSGWGTKAGFTLAREVLGSGVEDIDIDVMELEARGGSGGTVPDQAAHPHHGMQRVHAGEDTRHRHADLVQAAREAVDDVVERQAAQAGIGQPVSDGRELQPAPMP